MGVWKNLVVAIAAVLVVCSVFFFVGCGDDDQGAGLPEKLYLFGTAVQYDGNLGGRSGADAKCLSDANMPTDATVAYAFISVTDNDCIANMPLNYNFPDNVPIVAPDGVTVIADNWNDLLDGSIKVSLSDAGILPASKGGEWWSGSNSDGTLHAENCSGWTKNDGLDWGMVGYPDSLDAAWISDGPFRSEHTAIVLGIAY